MWVYVDGELVLKEDAKVSVFDHGFLYGDGVFEGIRVYSGTVFRLEEHVRRLIESAKSIALTMPMTPEEIIEATLDTVAANGKRDAYIRLVISRGRGDLGIDPSTCPKPSVVIIVDQIALYPAELYENGVSLITSSVRRIPVACLDTRIKSLNYLNNILAKIEAKNAGCVEAVMLNLQGRVAECTADNIFVVKDGGLMTPAVMEAALGGVTRGAVLDLAGEAHIPSFEGKLGLHDLYNADECFLTGTGAEIMPVHTIDGRPIGDGKPGPMTKRLLADFRKIRAVDGTRVDYDRVVPRVAEGR